MKRSLIAVVAAAPTLSGCSLQNQEWHADCLVQGKDILYSMSDGDSHRTNRLTTSCGTFNVQGSLGGGFNSWDNWSRLEVGKTYDLKTGGYRVGIASMFPTVIEVRGPKANVGQVV